MSTQLDSTLTPPRECPLHSTLRELAQLATAQHVFYLEGECLPRSDLLRRLQIWSSLHQVVSTRLCTATRDTPLRVEELESILEPIRPRMGCPAPLGNSGNSGTKDNSDHSDHSENSPALEETEELFLQRLSATLSICEACALATSCPLHEDAGGGGKERGVRAAASGRQP